MNTDIVTHYGGSSDLAERIRTSLVDAGMDIERLMFLGPDFPDMARNQVRNLAEKRIRTVTYICRG